MRRAGILPFPGRRAKATGTGPRPGHLGASPWADLTPDRLFQSLGSDLRNASRPRYLASSETYAGSAGRRILDRPQGSAALVGPRAVHGRALEPPAIWSGAAPGRFGPTLSDLGALFVYPLEEVLATIRGTLKSARAGSLAGTQGDSKRVDGSMSQSERSLECT